ncbi:hypothetical protein [Sphaerisporangium aureirubrum]|uniref:Uncharacterized protein n=1 Tax=Sphaerisporangium aureirubrum TaxID=1544736 RepID=A0ABW1N9U5_9ACTN
MSEPCEHRRGPRRSRRARAARGRAWLRAGRTAAGPRRGWFAHRCGVSRCHQVAEPARLSSEETTWRGDD